MLYCPFLTHISGGESSAKKSAIFTGVLYSGFHFSFSNMRREALLPAGVLASQLARISGEKVPSLEKCLERRGNAVSYPFLSQHMVKSPHREIG